jgi:hypothetical protein
MNHFIKNFFVFSLLLLIISVPVLATAEIIPSNCGDVANGQPECGYNDLLKLINNVIDWIMMVAVPVAAGIFAWVGFKYMTTGVSDQKSEAKKMLWKVFIGLVFILGAWLIVDTILKALTA